jgi:DNA-binding response OmpR family regulator
MRVLVAEDDPALRSVLDRGLRNAGYAVDAVADGRAALDFLAVYDYEVAVLDWRMPGLTGVEVVRALRRRGSRLPVLLLTARDTSADRVAGLDEGADDYLVKPFDFAELLARLRALQRRGQAIPVPRLVVGDLVFEPARREITVGGSPVQLTHTELAIVEVLLRRAPSVVAREAIAVQVWENEADAVGSNTIDVHVARIRSKLASAFVHIETIRGVGYRLVARTTAR